MRILFALTLLVILAGCETNNTADTGSRTTSTSNASAPVPATGSRIAR